MDALSHSKSSEARYHKHEAICWLSSNSRNFIIVCHFANLDPDYVRRKAKRALIAPLAWRAEAGKGSRYLERKAYRQRQKKSEKPSLPLNDINQDVEKIIIGPWSIQGD